MPARPRMEPWDAGIGGSRHRATLKSGKVGRHTIAQAGPFDRAFEAEHPLVNLEVIAGMSAAHHSPGSRADASIERDGVKRILSGIVQIAAAPGIADLAADIYACPSEHGNRRRWQSHGEIGRQSCGPAENDGTN